MLQQGATATCGNDGWMTPTQAQYPSFRFSTDALPVRDRVAVWREAFGRAVIKLDIEPLGEDPFRLKASLRSLPGVGFATVVTSACCAARTPELVRDSVDNVGLLVALDGTACVSQRGREVTLAGGDAVLLRNNEPGSARFPSRTRFLNFCMPERAVTPMMPNRDDCAMAVIPGGNEALRLLLNYVALLDANHDLATADTHHAMASHIHELVALAAGVARKDAAVGGRGVRAARLHAIKADIAVNLGQRDLSVGTVALRHRISPSYVRKLFDGDGTTFSEFVLGRRLARVHRILSDPRFADRAISTIAFEAGFGDLSYFNRAFRRRYGASPSDVRAAARSARA